MDTEFDLLLCESCYNLTSLVLVLNLCIRTQQSSMLRFRPALSRELPYVLVITDPRRRRD